MIAPILICTDLDRTLLPNGPAPESPTARDCFTAVVERPEVSLAYVTGRDRGRVAEAIEQFSLPTPQFVIGDVGTTVYTAAHGGWRDWPAWNARLAGQWPVGTRALLHGLLTDVREARLQEDSRQGDYKLSFYSDAHVEPEGFLQELRRRLRLQDIPARLIFSRDEGGLGLLDVVPAAAGKLAAIEFLMHERQFPVERTLFAGDSGNDLEVLASRLPAVLVANATEDVRRRAVDEALAAGRPESLYLARGGWRGMNGNYSAGILEGLAHFLPETLPWM